MKPSTFVHGHLIDSGICMCSSCHKLFYELAIALSDSPDALQLAITTRTVNAMHYSFTINIAELLYS